MELSEVIEKRKSVRKYLDQKVNYGELGLIIDAATKAPSAGNVQNWKFIVVTKDKTIKELSKASLKQDWMIDAPVLVVVCSELDRIKRLYGKRGKEVYARQNCAMAAENLLLAATDLGIGSCVVASFDEEAVRRILSIPDKVIPEMIITLGYAAEDLKQPAKDGPEVKSYFEKWGKSTADFDIWNLTKQADKLRRKLEKSDEKSKSKIREFIEKVKKRREEKKKAEEEAVRIAEEKEAEENF